MRCIRCKNKVAPGPERCPHCDGPLELGLGDVARWTLIGAIRRLRSGGAPALMVVAVMAAIVFGAVKGVQALFDGGDAPARAIVQAEVEPESAPEPVATTTIARVSAPVQERDIEPWLQVLGGADSETATGVASSASGELVFVGRSQGRGYSAVSDAMFVRTDESGIVLSRGVISGLVGAGASEVSIGADGAIYVAGQSGAALTLVRVDEQGEVMWEAAFQAGDDRAEPALIALSDTGVLAAAPASTPDHVLLVKMDDSGRETWRREVDAGGRTGRMALANAPAGGVYLTLSTDDADVGAAPPMIIRLEEDGAEVWRHVFSERATAAVDDVSAVLDGVVYVSGRTPLFDAYGLSTPWVARLSSEGLVDWEADLTADGVFAPVSIDVSSTHGVHLLAAAPSGNVDDQQIWLARIDWMGDLLWRRVLESASSIAPNDLTVTRDGDIVIAGGVSDEVGHASDILMTRIDEGGAAPLGLSSVAPTQPAEREGSDTLAPPAQTVDAPIVEATLDLSDPSLVEVAPPAPDAPAEALSSPVEEAVVEARPAAPAPVRPRSFACTFRCKTPGEDAVKYPVMQSYSGRGIQSAALFALEVQSETALVCRESGGVVDVKGPPACE